MLYLVATPIGNLEDITLRALSVLKGCDLILCEDTRRSIKLLNHFSIEKPLLSFHKFNEAKLEKKILTELAEGKEIALISDAGTPLINDPGFQLVQKCIENKIPFTAVPGPSSVIDALVLSGLSSQSFQFLGFLPKGQEERNRFIRKGLFFEGTTIFFESPHRLLSTLEAVAKIDANAHVVVARELTKMYEECIRDTAKSLVVHFQKHPPKGEIVLLLSKSDAILNTISAEEMIQLLCEYHGISTKDAIKQSAKLLNLPKKEIYKKMHSK
ncbi:MAG: 16S rRNA (cytidine(1402)-2'-O)-methyltransferase [Chlamydiae bacterium CG10_big_fil_rev_8_21_14_0_10_35_9]|nr:MAG: 16S rRNA (cytidine(1402)-2'-O)-methyltransferase [Chlamydiae bacterium CG10_big_fil_rev_8_21_14_0_10_35_9]